MVIAWRWKIFHIIFLVTKVCSIRASVAREVCVYFPFHNFNFARVKKLYQEKVRHEFHKLTRIQFVKIRAIRV